jgi:two-component system nitrogen regulation sensor histidine kinase GlnL
MYRVAPRPARIEVPEPTLSCLDWLSGAVLALDEDLCVIHANSAAETLLGSSRAQLHGADLRTLFAQPVALDPAIAFVRANDASYTEHELLLHVPGSRQVSCTLSPTDDMSTSARWLAELREPDRHARIAREEHRQQEQQANRELLRNLAHEIKNPLGGIRGAAQLLEGELDDPQLKEYTQVVIHESDRLQALMERLLAPHRPPRFDELNIHEVLERVRSLVLAESIQEGAASELIIRRDYDTSLPMLHGDAGQITQAVLNVVRNAAQAIQGRGEILLRTRAVRQVTLQLKRRRLGVRVEIIDNGPGIPEHIRDSLFHPLVTGRADGTGLGLSIAQTFIVQHGGVIEWDSEPGRTRFSILLPIESSPRTS